MNLNLTFTQAQQDLLNDLHAFESTLSTEPLAANLTAFAGCGKTTVLCAFIADLLRADKPVLIIAPTHAALGQLRLRLPAFNNDLNLSYKTSAAALGQFPVVSNLSAEVKFGGFGGKFFEGTVIVDESSMLGEKDAAKLAACGSKVIFSGDNGQMAPVKKKSSNAFLEALPTQFNLTEVLRSNDVISSEGIKARTINQYVPQSSPCGSITRFNTEAELLKAFYVRASEAEPGSVVWITYTNAEVAETNRHTHFLITGRNNLQAGDHVRLGLNCALGKNNTVVELDSVEPSSLGYVVTTKPSGDGTSHKVEIALPGQYAKVKDLVESHVEAFQRSEGNEALALRLEELRSVVPVDFIYAMTAHESQGSSIPEVYANSQRLHGKRSFYVAYSRASLKLNVCERVSKTKGFTPEGNVWVNKKASTFLTLDLDADLVGEASVVAFSIKAQFPDNPELWPSESHVACVLNPSHASKSAKGWTLAYVI
jgi:AAA domain